LLHWIGGWRKRDLQRLRHICHPEMPSSRKYRVKAGAIVAGAVLAGLDIK
jgi:hypothetical protein